jgi:hypothetical protein
VFWRLRNGVGVALAAAALCTPLAGAAPPSVTVTLARPGDPAKWTSFVTGLLHGNELDGLSLYLAPPKIVVQACGDEEALGCLGGREIVAIDAAVRGYRPQAVVAHEYGHLIAAYRSNAPWDAAKTGPKRWATAVGVCRHRPSTAYGLDPAEAWAETYRVVNGVASGRGRWPILARRYFPTPAALRAARADVLQPWTGPRSGRFTGRLDAGGRAVVVVPTPLDGTLEVDAQGASVGPARRIVCGRRSTTLRLQGPAGGAYALSVSRP